MRGCSTIGLGVFLVVLGVGRVAHAEGPSAEELFQQGNALVASGAYAEACPKLAESQRLEPAVGTQFNLADCYEKLGKTASAFRAFVDVAAIARAAGKFEREKSARARIAALEPRLARVQISVKDPAPGTELTLDGAELGRSDWQTARPVDPGRHTLVARAPNRTPWSVEIAASEGTVVEIAVPELVDPNPKKPVVVVPKTSTTQKTLAVVAGGVGVVGLGVGAVAGIIALANKAKASDVCPEETYHFRCPTEDGASRWTSAETAGTVSTVGGAVAVAFFAGAILLWVTAPSSKVRTGLLPNARGVGGTF